MKNKKISKIKNNKARMKNKIYVFVLIAFLLIMPLVVARDFVVYNYSDSAQPYFWVNGTTGKIYSNDGEITGGSSGTLSGAGIANYIPLWNGTTSLNKSNIYQLGGKIGIGTITPQNTLNVVGNGNFTGDLSVADLSLTGGDLSITNNNGGINFNDVSKYWMKTATNWGIYWDTTLNILGFRGAGTEVANIDLDTGDAQFDGNITADGMKANAGSGLVFNASTGTGTVTFIIG